MTPPATAPSGFFGWRVVAGAFVLATFGWGVGFYGPPVYLHAVQAARNWPVVLVSSAVTLHFLAGVIVIANLPALYRRFGVPAVTKLGAASLALGVLGWALAQEPWQLFLATVASGAGWVAMGAAAVNAIIAPWFVRARPRALSMAYNGASVGGIVLTPIWVVTIGWLGFPLAAALIGLFMTGIVWVLADAIFARTPAELGQAPDGGAAEMPRAVAMSPAPSPLPGSLLWRDRHFVTLALGMALSLVAQIGLIAHLFSLLLPALGDRGPALPWGLPPPAPSLEALLSVG